MLLRRQLNRLGIVLLTNHSDMRLVAALQKHVIKGWSYLLKRSVSDVDALSRAIEGAAEGYVLLDPEFAGKGARKSGGPLAKLSARQREILGLMAEGYTNAAIADRLMLAQKSVENQINQIYHALGIGRAETDYQPRVQAVLSYLRDAEVYIGESVRDSIA
jgi:DNA-binding NarL/FixJ family response regulator